MVLLHLPSKRKIIILILFYQILIFHDICIHTYIHTTYIHTHTHTHIHTYIHTFTGLPYAPNEKGLTEMVAIIVTVL